MCWGPSIPNADAYQYSGLTNCSASDDEIIYSQKATTPTRPESTREPASRRSVTGEVAAIALAAPLVEEAVVEEPVELAPPAVVVAV